jgi:[lysine-biosynthesis-protein LysW]--L-2-aminoadipate ligase
VSTPLLALVASRVRFEEKQLLGELDRSGIPYQQVDTRSFFTELSAGEPARPGYRVALIREISQTRSYYAARLLEQAGVRTVNPSAVIEACGDKLRTSLLLASAGVRTPRTAVALAPDGALAAMRRIGYPVVLKPLSGSWGRLLAVARDEETATALLEHRSALPAPQQHVIYIQELIDSPGRDIRVIMASGEPVGAIYRRATAGWRTNVALGATPEPCPLTPVLASLCREAARAVTGGSPGGTVLGVDLIEDRSGALHVLEVNHNVEFRGFTTAHESPRVAEVIVAEAQRILDGATCAP